MILPFCGLAQLVIADVADAAVTAGLPRHLPLALPPRGARGRSGSPGPRFDAAGGGAIARGDHGDLRGGVALGVADFRFASTFRSGSWAVSSLLFGFEG